MPMQNDRIPVASDAGLVGEAGAGFGLVRF